MFQRVGRPAQVRVAISGRSETTRVPPNLARHISRIGRDTLAFAWCRIHVLTDTDDCQDRLCLGTVSKSSESECPLIAGLRCSTKAARAHPITVRGPVVVFHTSLDTTCTLLALVRDCTILLSEWCCNAFCGDYSRTVWMPSLPFWHIIRTASLT